MLDQHFVADPTDLTEYYGYFIHINFRRIATRPPFARLAWLNKNAKGFEVNRSEFRQMYKAWAVDIDFYERYYSEIERTYMNNGGGGQ